MLATAAPGRDSFADRPMHGHLDETRGRRPDVVIVGGGFFGCRISVELARQGLRVLLLEAASDVMQRASLVNQARVHGGYHYPRSLLTALRSKMNLPAFSAEYDDCLDRSFTQYYAIAGALSKISHQQFRQFCERIQAPVRQAPESVQRLFDADLVEEVFEVEEYAFDSVRIKNRLLGEMAEAGVHCLLDAPVQRISRQGRSLCVEYSLDGVTESVESIEVINCTYSGINTLNRASGLPEIPLKHEIAEVALIEPPPQLAGIGVTVMCGPFFSTMPFPSRGLYSCTHVRYTPHAEWRDPAPGRASPAYEPLTLGTPVSAFPKMLADARRYLPCLVQSRHVESLFEVKTVLPQSEHDDSRPILFRTNHGLPGYTCVMGGKIDNIYDVFDELSRYTIRAGGQGANEQLTS